MKSLARGCYKILNENRANNQEEDGFVSNTIGVKTGIKEGTRETLETIEKAGDFLQKNTSTWCCFR